MGGAGSHHVHLANGTNYKVKVIVSPNKDWIFADLFVGVATIALDGYGVITTVSDLWRIWKAISFQKDAVNLALKIEKLFDKHAIVIDPKAVKDIYDHKLYNPLDYFTASGWAALTGGSEMCLSVLLEGPGNVKKLVQFNTNSDWSWIVHDDQVNRSKYGSLWQDDPASGNYKLVPTTK